MKYKTIESNEVENTELLTFLAFEAPLGPFFKEQEEQEGMQNL